MGRLTLIRQSSGSSGLHWQNFQAFWHGPWQLKSNPWKQDQSEARKEILLLLSQSSNNPNFNFNNPTAISITELIFTLLSGSFSQLIGISFILYPIFFAKIKTSTSKVQPDIFDFWKISPAAAFLNPLNPHWVSSIPQRPIMIFLYNLKPSPRITLLSQGWGGFKTAPLTSREPMTTSNPFSNSGHIFSTWSIEVELSASVKTLKSPLASSMPFFTAKPLPSAEEPSINLKFFI